MTRRKTEPFHTSNPSRLPSRLAAAGLISLLVYTNYGLLFGKSNIFEVHQMKVKLAETEHENERARERNALLAAEVTDLKKGLDMVDEIARYELGMIKPDEVFVQYTNGPIPAKLPELPKEGMDLSR